MVEEKKKNETSAYLEINETNVGHINDILDHFNTNLECQVQLNTLIFRETDIGASNYLCLDLKETKKVTIEVIDHTS